VDCRRPPTLGRHRVELHPGGGRALYSMGGLSGGAGLGGQNRTAGERADHKGEEHHRARVRVASSIPSSAPFYLVGIFLVADLRRETRIARHLSPPESQPNF
jgi:hypothetical protein